MLETLAVTEVIDPIINGMTEPYRCRLSDDNMYAVKGRQALARGLIAEAVSAHLASKIGIPIPPFSIAEVDQYLISAIDDLGFAKSIGPGFAFASMWIEPATPLLRSLVTSVSSRLLATIYVFDHWIKNGDRSLTEHGGNPNLLIDLRSGALVVIDHNLAFSETYDPAELHVHACRDAWLYERDDMVFTEECRRKFDDAVASVDHCIDNLPDEWLDQENGIREVISHSLRRHSEQQFWDEIS